MSRVHLCSCLRMRGATTQSPPNHHPITNQSPTNHQPITTQSRPNHQPITTQSPPNHSRVHMLELRGQQARSGGREATTRPFIGWMPWTLWMASAKAKVFNKFRRTQNAKWQRRSSCSLGTCINSNNTTLRSSFIGVT